MKKIFLSTLLLTAICVPVRAYIRFKEPQEAIALVYHFLPKNPVIVEAGAFDGTDTLGLMRYWPEATVHSFEPVPNIYNNFLTKKVAHVPNVHTYQMALSNANGIAPLFLSENMGCPEPGSSSSLLAPKEHLQRAPWVAFKQTISVRTMTLDSWAQQYQVSYVDFLWLDMQGAELAVLKAAPEVLKNVKAVLTEVEFVEAYDKQPLFFEIKKFMEEQGFVMYAFSHDIPWPANEWFGDALFVRKELLPYVRNV